MAYFQTIREFAEVFPNQIMPLQHIQTADLEQLIRQYDEPSCVDKSKLGQYLGGIIRGNHFDIQLYEEFQANMCQYMAYIGDVVALKYYHQCGCDVGEWTGTISAKNGHLECLQYAYEQGCPWIEQAYSIAVQIGRLECTKYLCQNVRQ